MLFPMDMGEVEEVREMEEVYAFQKKATIDPRIFTPAQSTMTSSKKRQ